MRTSSTVIKANTYIGSSETPAVLVVLPTTEPQPVSPYYENRYQVEAAQAFFFLQEIFCNQTLKALAERLKCYNDL